MGLAGSGQHLFSSVWYWLRLQAWRELARLASSRGQLTNSTNCYLGAPLGLLTAASQVSSTWHLYMPWIPHSMAAEFQETENRNCSSSGLDSTIQWCYFPCIPVVKANHKKNSESRREEIGSTFCHEDECTCADCGRTVSHFIETNY